MKSSSCLSLYWQCSCIPGENTHLCERLLAPVVKWSLPPLTTGLMWVSPSFLPGINFCLRPSHFSQSHSFYYTTRTAVWTSSTRRDATAATCGAAPGPESADWLLCAHMQMLRIGHTVHGAAYHNNGLLQGHRCLQAILQLYVRNCIKRKWTMKKYPIKCGVNKMSWYKSRL